MEAGGGEIRVSGRKGRRAYKWEEGRRGKHGTLTGARARVAKLESDMECLLSPTWRVTRGVYGLTSAVAVLFSLGVSRFCQVTENKSVTERT